MAWVIGMATLAPSCLNFQSKKAISLKNLPISDEDQSLISEICETIIPKTQSPGAIDLNLPQFVLKMLDETLSQKDQKNILAGLSDFKALVLKKSGRAFMDLESKEKEAQLLEIEALNRKMMEEDAHKKESLLPFQIFYRAIKGQILFAYKTSQYFLTKVNVYELVPGRYNVHFPIKNLKNA